MKFFRQFLSRFWLPQLHPQVWILAFGRLLSEIGSGFTLFYAPIFFVNQVGLSATEVGFALGSSSISGVLGRILGGSFADSKFWGRRRTLLLSSAISAIACLVLATASDFATLIVGNLLLGLGFGFYWPANEAVVADLTTVEHRREAYALTGFADNLGLGLGIIFGGMLISMTGAYRALFVIDACSFVIFWGVIYLAIVETHKTDQTSVRPSFKNGWKMALSDRRFLVYILVNVIFTTYISQMQSTLPLYFNKFVPLGNGKAGFSEASISGLFAWNIIILLICVMPITRILKRFSQVKSLTISALMWALVFVLIWATGVVGTNHLIWAIAAMSVAAIASVAYGPAASSLVADIAPPSRRGVYLSINSLCWAVGYFIGPPLGGWALDQPRSLVYSYWLFLALSVGITILILQYLDRVLHQK